jgi:hypothetical protein
MRFRLILPALICLAVTASFAQRTYQPDLEGYVTRVNLPSEIDVNGTHVRINDQTQFYFLTKKACTHISAQESKPYLGQSVQVYGKRHDKQHAIDATQVNVRQQEPREVSGSGVVDALPPAGADVLPESHLLRADGYIVLITKETALTFEPPLAADAAFRTNVWVRFHGKQRIDGVVVASKASFRQNSVNEDEETLRQKTEHDPAAVDPNAKQSGLSKAFRGIDPGQIPPHIDSAMQVRVSAIGAKLVPKYQLDLPGADEAKIDFRFQVVDQDKWHDAVTWPNGIILVPYQIIERMQNDSQLAAVLADNIACAMEKQTFRLQPKAHGLAAASAATGIGGAFVPGLGLLGAFTTGITSETLLRQSREQSGRVGLFLLHDAGYDINEAPVAWWLLAARKATGTEETPIPARAAYLYKTLGESWHND